MNTSKYKTLEHFNTHPTISRVDFISPDMKMDVLALNAMK